jgi:hypothetical protein
MTKDLTINWQIQTFVGGMGIAMLPGNDEITYLNTQNTFGPYSQGYTLVGPGLGNSSLFEFESQDAAVAYIVNLTAPTIVNDVNTFFGSTLYSYSGNYSEFSRDAANALAAKVDKVAGKGLSTEDYSTAEKTKLAGISTGATANDTDANLKSRANHTGTQSVSTITGLATVATSGSYNDLSSKPSIPAAQIQSDWTQASSGSLDFIKNKPSLATVAASGSYTDLSNKPTINNMTVYSGTTAKSSPVLYTASATVSSGVAVFNLTDNGAAGGNPLFPNGPITASLNCFVSDSAASYQMAGAWSNSNKTLTVTTNKLGTASLLTGILGQVAGNGAVVNVQVWGN